MRWNIILAVKSAQSHPKSRLRALSSDEQAHLRLVDALRTDTQDAVRAASSVARVLVVSDRPGAGVDLVQSDPGLNAAYQHGLHHLRQSAPSTPVALLVGDLPCLRSEDIDATLHAAAEVRAGYVRDWHGDGTTLVTATAGTQVMLAFGADSARRHAQTMTALQGDERLRADVDTPDDLRDAYCLGLGPATSRLWHDMAVSGTGA